MSHIIPRQALFVLHLRSAGGNARKVADKMSALRIGLVRVP